MFLEEKEALNLSKPTIEFYRMMLKTIGEYFEFDENSEGKYTALGWTKVADPAFEMMSYSQYFTEAKDIWEFNMAEYGYWKWGDL